MSVAFYDIAIGTLFVLEDKMNNGFKRLKSNLKRVMNKDVFLMGTALSGAIYYNAYKNKFIFIKDGERTEFNKIDQVWRHYER